LNTTVVGPESGHVGSLSLETSNVDGRRTILVLLQSASSTPSSTSQGSTADGVEALITLEIRITGTLDEHQYQIVRRLGFRHTAEGHCTNQGDLVATGYGVFERNEPLGVYGYEDPDGSSFQGVAAEQLLLGIDRGTGTGTGFDTHTGNREDLASPYQQTLDMD